MRELDIEDWNQSAILFLRPNSAPSGRENVLFEGSLAGAVAMLKGQASSGHIIWTASFVYADNALNALLEFEPR